MKNTLDENYFKAGQDWYVDQYELIKVQSNRWFIGLLVSMTLCVVLTVALIALFPLKTLIPFVIHQNTTTGEVWVDRPKTSYLPANDAEVESDIVRYLTAYKGYTAADINQRFNFVVLLSANNIAKQYADEQSNGNRDSPINTLAKDGTRTVRVEDIVFIDKAGTHEVREFKEPSHNLAKVDLITTTIDHVGNKKVESLVATIGWTYKGLPKNQQDAWDNWNGFTVTSLRIDPKNIG